MVGGVSLRAAISPLHRTLIFACSPPIPPRSGILFGLAEPLFERPLKLIAAAISQWIPPILFGLTVIVERNRFGVLSDSDS